MKDSFISIPNYNLKTRCTVIIVIPSYDVSNIPKLIFLIPPSAIYIYIYEYMDILLSIYTYIHSG